MTRGTSIAVAVAAYRHVHPSPPPDSAIAAVAVLTSLAIIFARANTNAAAALLPACTALLNLFGRQRSGHTLRLQLLDSQAVRFEGFLDRGKVSLHGQLARLY